ncbi:MAG: co-chaperone GroES [Patescibacteria group bacterium]|nr:co-chaperone GroES [Patescibacteria group bacterium]
MVLNALAAVPNQPDSEATPDIQQHQKLLRWIKSTNIAKELDAELLSRIGERVVKEYEIDDNSRSDWKTKTEQAMDLAMQVAKEKQFPWPKAANVIYPLMTTASIQFAARAYPAIVANRSVVKGVVVGADDGQPVIDMQTGQPVIQPGPNGQPMPVWQVPPGAKQKRADDIGEHMSWQLLDEQTEWEPETDAMLHILPVVGCDFRKSYFDPGKGRNASLRVTAMNLVINYHAKSLETAPRLTEEIRYYPIEIEEQERAGIFLKPEEPYGRAEDGQEGDDDAPHMFLEQHRWWDLDDDNYPEPYIVTVHKKSRKVVRIIARYDADGIHFSNVTHKIVKIDPVHYYTKYDFLPNPDGGVYGVGFGQLLRPINEAVNTTLNQLLDAGTLANTGGGFIGKGLSMNAGAIRFIMGEYKVVNVAGGTLRENIVPMQFPGPSSVLFNLLGMLVEAGKEVAAVKDVLTGDTGKNANIPATTTLALIEQGLKVFTAIYKRIHRALKSELNKLYRLNRIYGDEKSQYKVGDTWKVISKQDYVLGSGVEPVSDPTMVSDMQRLGRAQFLMQFANDPYFNAHEIRRRILSAASIDDIDKVLNAQAPPNPQIAIKGLELEQRGHEVQATISAKKATEVREYSQAILNLANADAAVGDQHLQWLNQQLAIWEKQFDAANQTNDAGQAGAAPGSPPPPALPHPMAMPNPTQPGSEPTVNIHNPAASLGVVGQ